MTTPHIPAWKKLGLKVNQESQEDPLALTTHLESANVTNKDIKKINKQKRKLEELKANNNTKINKPLKRVKLPKTERPPPPEKDQLVYLRQYQTDRNAWKFSKQKQNWILKNIRHIPNDFESALVDYLEGLQGNSRKRLLEELKQIMNKWNKIAEEAEARVDAELNGTAKSNDDEKKKENKNINNPQQEESPDHDYAVRCRKIFQNLSDEQITLKGIVDDTEDDVKVQDNEASVEADSAKESSSKIIASEVDAGEDEAKSNLVIDEAEVAYIGDETDVIESSEDVKSTESTAIEKENVNDTKKSKKNKSKKSKSDKKEKKSKTSEK